MRLKMTLLALAILAAAAAFTFAPEEAKAGPGIVMRDPLANDVRITAILPSAGLPPGTGPGIV